MILSIHLHSYHRRISILFYWRQFVWLNRPPFRFTLFQAIRFIRFVSHSKRLPNYFDSVNDHRTIEEYVSLSQSQGSIESNLSSPSFFVFFVRRSKNSNKYLERFQSNDQNVSRAIISLDSILPRNISFPVNFARWWWCSTRETLFKIRTL